MSEQKGEKDRRPPNYFAPDGYRYGVMFSDGSVGEWYSGQSQRQRAEEEAEAIVREQFARAGRHDHISVARRLPDGQWERIASPSLPPAPTTQGEDRG